MATTSDLSDPAARPSSHLSYARRSFLPRMVGLALGFLMVAAVAYEHRLPAWMWLGPVLHCFGGPHLFWWLARHAPDARRAERRNLLADHFLGGMWTALMAFNVLPCVLTLCLLSMDSMAGGGTRLLLRGLLFHALGVVAGMLLYGAHWQPDSSMLTVLASLPILVLQPLVISQTASLAIRKLQKKRAELEYQGRHDGLSGLFNRTHWELLVRSEFARFQRAGQAASLVLADLDHFKRINDVHGHAAGDEAIRQFARALAKELRETDFPGRYGGEEFGILLPNTSADEAREVIERLRCSLHDHPLLSGAVVTASFGVAELSAEVDTAAAWLRLADQMLYRAKHLGRDRIAVLGDEHDETRDEQTPAALPFKARSTLSAMSTAVAGSGATAMSQLFSGLDMSRAPMALFDPSDRLVLANAAFTALYAVQADACTFGDVMRHCFERQVGPRINTDDIDAWLRQADARRRSRPAREFVIDTVDGRHFQVTETSFGDGWVLSELVRLDDRHRGIMPAPLVAPLQHLRAGTSGFRAAEPELL